VRCIHTQRADAPSSRRHRDFSVCVCAQHLDEEYGGPFYIEVSPKMKVEDLRIVIRVRMRLCCCAGAIMRQR
jgi:hypothetical protein